MGQQGRGQSEGRGAAAIPHLSTVTLNLFNGGKQWNLLTTLPLHFETFDMNLIAQYPGGGHLNVSWRIHRSWNLSPEVFVSKEINPETKVEMIIGVMGVTPLDATFSVSVDTWAWLPPGLAAPCQADCRLSQSSWMDPLSSNWHSFQDSAANKWHHYTILDRQTSSDSNFTNQFSRVLLRYEIQ